MVNNASKPLSMLLGSRRDERVMRARALFALSPLAGNITSQTCTHTCIDNHNRFRLQVRLVTSPASGVSRATSRLVDLSTVGVGRSEATYGREINDDIGTDARDRCVPSQGQIDLLIVELGGHCKYIRLISKLTLFLQERTCLCLRFGAADVYGSTVRDMSKSSPQPTPLTNDGSA